MMSGLVFFTLYKIRNCWYFSCYILMQNLSTISDSPRWLSCDLLWPCPKTIHTKFLFLKNIEIMLFIRNAFLLNQLIGNAFLLACVLWPYRPSIFLSFSGVLIGNFFSRKQNYVLKYGISKKKNSFNVIGITQSFSSKLSYLFFKEK